MRIDRTLLRLRRLWTTGHGTAWLLSMLLIGAYTAMVVQQIRAATTAGAPGASGLVARSERGSGAEREPQIEETAPAR